jgi:cytochrome c biogenesis protein CcmG/thiol:disulfide interchange protein DsbE
MRNWIRVIVLLTIVAGFTIGTIVLYENSTPVKVGEEAPVFTMEILDGSTKTFSEFRGKSTTLIFFTTWCPSCRQQAPYITKFAKEHGDTYEIVYINRRDAKVMVQDFVKEFEVTSTVFLDKNDSQASPYGLTGQPEAFFIDKNGVLLYHHIGPMTDKFLLSKWTELGT